MKELKQCKICYWFEREEIRSNEEFGLCKYRHPAIRHYAGDKVYGTNRCHHYEEK